MELGNLGVWTFPDDLDHESAAKFVQRVEKLEIGNSAVVEHREVDVEPQALVHGQQPVRHFARTAADGRR